MLRQVLNRHVSLQYSHIICELTLSWLCVIPAKEAHLYPIAMDIKNITFKPKPNVPFIGQLEKHAKKITKAVMQL